MVFAVCDFFERGWGPPADCEPPRLDSPLFRYLVRRLFQSFRLPFGPLRYYWWMTANDRAVMWNTIRREWPRVRRELDSGRLAALGLIRAHSRNPFRLGENHQVLAYGYELDDDCGLLSIAIYDPNHPSRDDVRLSLNVGRADGITSTNCEPCRGFFWTPYRMARAAFHPGNGVEKRHGS
jgi:hypothetical protein